MLLIFLLFSSSLLTSAEDCQDPEVCPESWALQHRPLIRFDGSAQEYCYPAEATNANNGLCTDLNPEAPIYYAVVRCGDFLKLAWHLWYGHQRGCDPFGVDHGHDDDWEHITINFIRDNQTWTQDSVTFHQHSGFYTRRNTQQTPDVYVGKIAHGSYDNWCDGVGFVWEGDYCAGGCGYWDDFRNDDQASRWLPTNIKHVSEHGCEGSDWRCVGLEGPCGCWRSDHTFPADQICDL